MVWIMLVLLSWRAEEKGWWDQYVLFLLTRNSIKHPSQNRSIETMSGENQVLSKQEKPPVKCFILLMIFSVYV